MPLGLVHEAPPTHLQTLVWRSVIGATVSKQSGGGGGVHDGELSDSFGEEETVALQKKRDR